MINWCREVILPFKVTLKKKQALYFGYLIDYTHSLYWKG